MESPAVGGDSVPMLNAPTSGRPHCNRISLVMENHIVILLSISFVRFKVGILLYILDLKEKCVIHIHGPWPWWHTLSVSTVPSNHSIDQWWPLHGASKTAESFPIHPLQTIIMYHVPEITRYRPVDQRPESVLVMSCYHLGYVYTNKRCRILRR